MTHTNGTLERIQTEALALTGGVMSDRTRLAALAMHAHIINLSPDCFGWPADNWHRGMSVSAVKSADAVLARLKGGGDGR